MSTTILIVLGVLALLAIFTLSFWLSMGKHHSKQRVTPVRDASSDLDEVLPRTDRMPTRVVRSVDRLDGSDLASRDQSVRNAMDFIEEERRKIEGELPATRRMAAAQEKPAVAPSSRAEVANTIRNLFDYFYAATVDRNILSDVRRGATPADNIEEYTALRDLAVGIAYEVILGKRPASASVDLVHLLETKRKLQAKEQEEAESDEQSDREPEEGTIRVSRGGAKGR